jgi:hypothetical protein
VIPHGYSLALVGVVLVSAGGMADFAWHEVFGFDDGVKAAYSPPHLVLMMGGLLLTSTPARAMWGDRQEGHSFGSVIVPLMSVTVTLAVGMFFLNYNAVFFRNLAPTEPFAEEVAAFEDAEEAGSRSLTDSVSDLSDDLYPYDYFSTTAGSSAIFVTNVLLMGAVLVLLRRYRLPFGAVTLMFLVLGVAFTGISGFRDAPLMFVMAAGGIAADVLIWRMAPYGAARVIQFRIVAAGIPVALWTAYFVVLQVAYGGVAWPVPIWSGAIVWAAIAGVLLSLVMAPTPAHLAVDDSLPV